MTILEQYFEKSAERYWSPLRGLTGRDAAVYPLLAELGGPNCALLEYGFGSGSLLFPLAKEPRFSSVFGVEISQKQIERCRAELENIGEAWCKKVKFLAPEDDRLPGIADESIDVILCFATIELVLDPFILLDEFFRIGAPDAQLVCSFGNLAYLKHRIRLMAGRLPQLGTGEPVSNWRAAGWDGMRLHNFTKRSFTVLLNDCGWKPVSWSGRGDRFPGFRVLRTKFPSLFSGELIVTCSKRRVR